MTDITSANCIEIRPASVDNDLSSDREASTEICRFSWPALSHRTSSSGFSMTRRLMRCLLTAGGILLSSSHCPKLSVCFINWSNASKLIFSALAWLYAILSRSTRVVRAILSSVDSFRMADISSLVGVTALSVFTAFAFISESCISI